MKRALLISIFLLSLLSSHGQITTSSSKSTSHKAHQNTNSKYLLRSTLGINGLSKVLSANTGSYIIQQSIGQASVIGTYSKNNYTIRQGFLQPPNQVKVQLIDIIENHLKATLYPNPFKQAVKISFNELISDDVFVVVYNMSGTVMLSKKYPASQLINLPMNSVAKGDYILKATTGNKRLVAKLIKQ